MFVPAAAVALIRHQAELEVLMVRRAENQRAFPGFWVFPGGVVDPGDRATMGLEASADAAFRGCALRELFEETGLLPGYAEPGELGDLQQDLLAGRISWEQLCRQLDHQPPSAALIGLGLRVMPAIAPRRFETHYFLWADPGFQFLPACKLSPELTESGWFAPAELLKRWESGVILIPPPVLEVLKVLADHGVDLDRLRALANTRETLPQSLVMHPGVEMIPLRTPTLAPATHTNCYLVGESRFVIIDPATPYPEEQAVLKQSLQRRLDLGHQPLAVLLTHHHRDHVGAAEFVRNWLRVPICAHLETAALLGFGVDESVADGQRWSLDPATNWSLEALFTPGHAPGHLCFVESRHRAAIVGDMLAGIGTILIKRPRGDMGQYLASLQRLAKAGLSRGLPAHGPLIADLPARCHEYIAHRRMREERILAALDAGPLPETELLQRVYGELAPELLPIASWSLDAHLQHLRQGLAISLTEGLWCVCRD
ncbi:MAG: hypothetical protein CVV27_06100 [Candidatus Melainabacteria bacterium HGW-Melainabacteria-1]|nr:MAG: hypothetical protein CVV27_06100 [Candidatus Melainabacteria bacterium HGW-Melainabacteria-1]